MPAFVTGPAILFSHARNSIDCRRRLVSTKRAPKRSLRSSPLVMSRAGGDGGTGKSGVNVSKFASQRSIISAEKDVTPQEINELLIKAGKPVCRTSTLSRSQML